MDSTFFYNSNEVSRNFINNLQDASCIKHAKPHKHTMKSQSRWKEHYSLFFIIANKGEKFIVEELSSVWEWADGWMRKMCLYWYQLLTTWVFSLASSDNDMLSSYNFCNFSPLNAIVNKCCYMQCKKQLEVLCHSRINYHIIVHTFIQCCIYIYINQKFMGKNQI